MVDVPRFGTDSFSMGLSLNYAYKPLVLGVERPTGEFQTLRVLIEHQLLGQLDVAASLCDCAVFSLSLPIALMERGDSSKSRSSSARSWSRWASSAAQSLSGGEPLAGLPPLRGMGAREPRVGTLLRLYGQPDTSPFSVSAGGYLWLPLRRMIEGTAPDTSDEEFRAMPKLVLAGYSAPIQWSLTGSFLYRPEARQDTPPALGGTTEGSELQAGTHISYTDRQRGFSLGPEALLTTVLIPREHAFEPFYTSLEVLLGLQFKAGQAWQVGLAAGAGLMRQPGTPEFRFLLRVSSTSTPTRRSEGPEAPAVLPHEPRAVPFPFPIPVPLGVADASPIPLDGQASPEAPQEETPEPELPQDESTGDRDQDTVADSLDACPDQPGAPSVERSKSGCPGLVAVKGGMLLLQSPVVFARGTDTILEESLPVLRAIADALRASPWIQKLRIEGNTDDQGPLQINNSLSVRRAQRVMRWLQEDGIDPARMEAVGYGPSRPIASNDTEQGRAANRRVDFVIIEPPTARAGDEHP